MRLSEVAVPPFQEAESWPGESTAMAYGDVPRGLPAGVEMLVEPVARRGVKAPCFPGNLEHLVPVPVLVGPRAQLLGPDEDVPL